MHNRQKNKESKTYVQGLRSFGNTLPRGIKGILRKNGYNYSEIISKWKILVGNRISNCAYPKSIQMKNGDSKGTLVIAVERGEEINVEYSKRQIIDKINSNFGYRLIGEIRLQKFSNQKKIMPRKNLSYKFSLDLKKKVNQIKSKNLKNSLTELINTIKND